MTQDTQQQGAKTRIAVWLSLALLIGAGMLVMLWYVTRPFKTTNVVKPLPRAHSISTVCKVDALGNEETLRLPVNIPADGPFTIRFEIPYHDPTTGNTLSFQSNYMEFTLSFEQKTLYAYTVSKDSPLKSGGYLMHNIDLPAEVEGQTVEMRIVPTLPSIRSQKLNEMYLASVTQVTLDRYRAELHTLFFSGLIILLFFPITGYIFLQRRKYLDSYALLFHMVFLGLLVSVYLLLQLWTINRMLQSWHLLAYVLEYSMLCLVPIPLLFILRHYASPAWKTPLAINVWVLCTYLLVQYGLVLTGGPEFREMLSITHAILLLSILNSGAALISIGIKRFEKAKLVFVSVLPLLIGISVATISYLATGILVSPLMLLVYYLVFLIAQLLAATGRYIRLRENAVMSDLYRRLATIDSMTGLENRNAYNDLEAELTSTRQPGWIAIMDLNNLKLINDTQGHRSGDALLIAFSRKMKELASTLEGGRLYRTGGDEFVLFSSAPRSFDMERWIRDQAEVLRKGWDVETTPPPDFAFGVSYRSADTPFEAAAYIADLRMYAHKQQQRHQSGIE